MIYERRRGLRPLELRAGGGSSAGTAAGYAAVFNAPSEDLGGFVEIIAPGAFVAALGADIRALWNHEDSEVLGRTRSGTLRLGVDATGLSCEIDLPDTATGRDAAALLARGDVDGMSVGFRTIRDSWASVEGKTVRTLLEVDLVEVSIVAFPAYPDTEVALRGLNRFRRAVDPAANAVRARMGMDLRLIAAR